MGAKPERRADEIKLLRRCINDLVSVLALPAMWTGSEPSHIVSTLLDTLLGMLRLDFIYARWKGTVGAGPVEVVRAAPAWRSAPPPQAIGQMLSQVLGDDSQKWPPVARNLFGGEEISLVPMRLGTQGEIGLIVAASRRPSFPEQTERLVLSIAANQASIGLQEAQLRSVQKRVASELDRRVTERTAELATTNEELRNEIAERKVKEEKLRLSEEALRDSEQRFRLIVDGIAGLVAIMSATGEVETANRQALEYFGKSTEELKHWSTTDDVHPDDLAGVISAWTHSVETGAPYDVDHRLRRADGVYRWFHARGLPLRHAEGRIVRWYVLLTDIDDRMRAEEAVRQNERRFRMILDGVPAFVTFMGPSGEVEFANQTLLQYFNATSEEVKTWPSGSTFHPDDRDKLLSAWRRSIASGQPYEFEARHQRADGVYRWFHMRGAPLRGADGQILLWYLMQIDIDDQKRAEQAVAANERNLNLIINTIPALAWSANPDGTADFINRPWLEYTGLTEEQARGWGWGAAIHPEDRDALVNYWQSCLISGTPVEAEARMRRFDGAYRWFLFRASALRDEAGKIVKWYGTNTDIDDRRHAESELRRSEAFLARGQHLSRTGTFSWRVSADEINWSEQLYSIFEFEAGVPVTLEMIGSRVHPDDIPLLNDMIERARNAVSDFEYDHRLMMPDHSVKYLHMVGHATRNQNGEVEYIGACQDVTQRRLSEHALAQARSELVRVARITSLGALTASIAHEVNQPLSGIVTNASTCLRMLAGDPPNLDGAGETARRTIRDANRATDVITRLRALFSNKKAATEAVDLSEAAREVVALSLSELHGNRVILRSELADDLPPVTGDRVQLQQVILNLLRNAADAMSAVEDRPRHLLIRTERDGGDQVRLTVRDSGIGFDPQAADRLFQAFYTTKGDGMGIGLSVSRSIIESHHGRLWAARNDGPGATFCFSIPCGRNGVTETGGAGAV